LPADCVVRMAFVKASTAEYRDAGTDKMQRPKAPDEFLKDLNGKGEFFESGMRTFQKESVIGRPWSQVNTHDCRSARERPMRLPFGFQRQTAGGFGAACWQP